MLNYLNLKLNNLKLIFWLNIYTKIDQEIVETPSRRGYLPYALGKFCRSRNVVYKFAAWPLPLKLPVWSWVLGPGGAICMHSCTMFPGARHLSPFCSDRTPGDPALGLLILWPHPSAIGRMTFSSWIAKSQFINANGFGPRLQLHRGIPSCHLWILAGMQSLLLS